jgi:ABC-type transport system involved in cytochrome c biogenesis permease subunit
VPARLRDIPLPALAWSAVVVLGSAIALIFFYAPLDADQGLTQKIFYIHVPIALTAYAGFGWGAWKAFTTSAHARARQPTSRATQRSTRA